MSVTCNDRGELNSGRIPETLWYMFRYRVDLRTNWTTFKCSELSSGLYCRVNWLSTDVSEVRTASIIRYRRLAKDPTDAVERKTNLLLRKSSLPEEVIEKLRPQGSRPPRLYELPKIHKDGVPLRPIVSTIGAPTYRLAQHLAGLPVNTLVILRITWGTQWISFIRSALFELDPRISSSASMSFPSSPWCPLRRPCAF
jgi:hypothetical protein